MRYQMLNHPCDFEIPDAWLIEAGMESFASGARAYRSAANAQLVPLIEVEPPYRLPAVQKDGRGFDRVRLISVLAAIASSEELPAVPVAAMPQPEDQGLVPRSPFNYRVRDGYHRFYASIAAGFDCLPVLIS